MAGNIKYNDVPQIIEFSNKTKFVFLPYIPHTSIGEILASSELNVGLENWVLVAYGDYLANTTIRNNYENGLYMPLSAGIYNFTNQKKYF